MKCPVCGQVFRFRPPKMTPAAKGVLPVKRPESPTGPTRLEPPPAWKAPPPPPVPVVAPVAAPVAAPPGVIAAIPVAPPRPTPPPVVKPGEKIVHVRGLRGSRARHPILKLVVVTLVVLVFLGALVAGISHFGPMLHFDRIRDVTGPGGLIFQMRTSAGEERVLTLNLDKTTWIADRDLKIKLRSLAAFQRENDWLAIAIQDYGTRAPRQGELIAGAIERLQTLFPDLQIDSNRLEPAKIGGLDAMKAAFKGSDKNVTHFGECYLIAHHGFAYWVLIASRAGSIEAAQSLAVELDTNGALAFTTERRGWTEQPPKMDTFTAQSGAYNVLAPEKVWRASDPKTADDKHGELFLAGNFRSLPGQTPDASFAKNATLLGVSLDRKVDLEEAYKEAVAYFEKVWQEQNKNYAFLPIKDGGSLSSEEFPIGALSARMGEARLKLGDEKVRYLLIAVFSDAQKTHALQFECPLQARDIWQKEFQDILKTAKLNTEK